MKLKGMSKATFLIILLGMVSLFADFTYEGGRSIIPQFFTSVLGGSVFMLGAAIGVGEFLGYSFRLVSGKLADRTRSYWPMVFIGYVVNLAALPLLAFSGNYLTAIVLIFAERLGKATRSPPKDYLVSTIADKGKVGRAFAINAALDQTGAVVGPLAVALILLFRSSYRLAFMFLALPAAIAVIFLFIAYRYFKAFKTVGRRENRAGSMTFGRFLVYSAAVAISAAGLYQVYFILYGAQGVISTYLIPIIFLVAMAGEGFFGFVFGMLYDRVGRKLVYAGLLTTLVVPFVLLGRNPVFLFLGALAFGAVVGIQDTVMRSVVGSMIGKAKRGFAYGIFNTMYGMGLMAAGIVIGYIYHSMDMVIAYVVIAQIVASVALYLSFRE